MKTRTNPSGRCPACLLALTGAMAVEGHWRPRPGDLSLCIRCGQVLLFNTDLTVRRAPQDVLDKLGDQERRELELGREAIRRLHQ